MAEPFSIEFEFRNQRYRNAERGLRAFAKQLGTGVQRAGPILKKELREYLDASAIALAERHGGAYPGGTTQNSLSRRSGRLVRSVRQSVKVKGSKVENVEGRIGTPGIVYGRMHEFGGKIRPKKAKYLTVPLDAALNKDGTPKKKSAREWDNSFVAKSKKGNLIIFQRRAGKIIPLYVLKEEVTIPPRLKMGETLRSQLPFFVDRTMDRMVKELLRKR